jgi:hypothetical protein
MGTGEPEWHSVQHQGTRRLPVSGLPTKRLPYPCEYFRMGYYKDVGRSWVVKVWMAAVWGTVVELFVGRMAYGV